MTVTNGPASYTFPAAFTVYKQMKLKLYLPKGDPWVEIGGNAVLYLNEPLVLTGDVEGGCAPYTVRVAPAPEPSADGPAGE